MCGRVLVILFVKDVHEDTRNSVQASILHESENNFVFVVLGKS